MSEFEAETTTPIKSKYNNAIDQIYRLGIIWRNAYKHCSESDFNSWNLDLDAVWREFAGDLAEEDPAVESYNKINKALIDLFPLTKKQALGFNPISKGTLDKISKQYLKLQEKEIFLRRLQNKLGKGTAWDDTEDDDFG